MDSEVEVVTALAEISRGAKQKQRVVLERSASTPAAEPTTLRLLQTPTPPIWPSTCLPPLRQGPYILTRTVFDLSFSAKSSEDEAYPSQGPRACDHVCAV